MVFSQSAVFRSHVLDVKYDEITDDDIKHGDLCLDPSKVQKKFKALFEAAMEEVELPDNWEHGGRFRPEFSGIRRHGPATMVMLVYRSRDEEFKITVDVTLGSFVAFMD